MGRSSTGAAAGRSVDDLYNMMCISPMPRRFPPAARPRPSRTWTIWSPSPATSRISRLQGIARDEPVESVDDGPEA